MKTSLFLSYLFSFFSVLSFFLFVPLVRAGGATIVVVKPTDMATSVADVLAKPDSWLFYNDETDTIDNSLGSFVMGPATPFNGVGSVQISVSGTQRRNLATYRFSGTPLADITTLRFKTYNPSAGNGEALGSQRSGYLHFNVDFNGTDTWQRRLVFVPSVNSTVSQDTWQDWDAIDGGNAKWLYSGATWPVTGEAGTTTKTWNQILTDYPGVRMRVTDSFLGIRVGEPYADGYTENIDGFAFGTGSNLTIFDFEPLIGPPVTKEDCKNDGWKTFNNPSFKNKGKCIDYVEHHKHVIKGEIEYNAYGLVRKAEFEMDSANNKGKFSYKDKNKNSYKVNVSVMKVDGKFGWFAGEVVKASNPAWVGQWLFAKVSDNKPASDEIWGSFTDMATAQNGVANMLSPADGPFAEIKGNIIVK
ncbi:MAG: hypothetical protein NUV52_00935 [Candidatus Roizmanbacteria bacterium]|nr:hypothetical protein [Candidatus Roizmanbacteria bacterium]